MSKLWKNKIFSLFFQSLDIQFSFIYIRTSKKSDPCAPFKEMLRHFWRAKRAYKKALDSCNGEQGACVEAIEVKFEFPRQKGVEYVPSLKTTTLLRYHSMAATLVSTGVLLHKF